MELRNSSNKRYNYNCIQTVFRFNYIFLNNAIITNIQKYPKYQLNRPRNDSLSSRGNRDRSRSDSRKRKAEDQEATEEVSNQETPWSQVVAGRGRKRPIQYGTNTSQVKVKGAEAAPYDVYVGNTHPDSTEDIVKQVLIEVSQNMSEENKLDEPLQILEVECLTKPRTDGRKIWSRNWRVQVPNRFCEHMLKSEAYPSGWSSRRYFPARAAHSAVPPLYPNGCDAKRPNLGPGHEGNPPVSQ